MKYLFGISVNIVLLIFSKIAELHSFLEQYDKTELLHRFEKMLKQRNLRNNSCFPTFLVETTKKSEIWALLYFHTFSKVIKHR